MGDFVVVAAAEKHREFDEWVRALWFHQRMSRTKESASAPPVADAVVVLAVHTKFAEVDKEEWIDTFPIVEVAKAETLHSTEIQLVVDHLLTVTFQ